jgi:hypothetical protein
MRVPAITSVALSFFMLAGGSSTASAQGRLRTVCTDGTKSEVVGSVACASHGGIDAKATEKLEKAESKAATTQMKAVDKAAKDINKADAKADKATIKAETKAEKDINKADEKADKAEAKADKEAFGAIALCGDGTYWHARTQHDACKGHNGVSKILK